MAVAVRLDRVSLPDVAFVPVQPSLAVHDVALVLDHVNVVEPLYATFCTLAVNVAVGNGAAPTVIVTLLLVVPPDPVQLSE